MDQNNQPFSSEQVASIGTTTVTRTVTDLAGYATSTSFTIIVRGVGDLFVQLRAMLGDLNLPTITKRVLQAETLLAERIANLGQPRVACLQLSGLDVQIRMIEMLWRVSQPAAAEIYAQTQLIRGLIGCGSSVR